jgi:hypothetical protein
MDAFFGLANIFRDHPERAYLVALVFMGLALVDRRLARIDPSIRPWGMLVPAAGWLLYAINEYHARLDGPGPRLDLYLTWPVMVLLTGLFGALWVANLRRALRRRNAGPDDPPVAGPPPASGP